MTEAEAESTGMSTGSSVGAERPLPTHIADYQVQRSLGLGNNGRVLLARPPQRLRLADEFVAVKVFDAQCSDSAYERCVEELRSASALDSPYLARVVEAALDGSSFFYAMDYRALGSLAAPGRPLSRTEVQLAVSHAASAAHTLHEAGIAHAAIKPQNILIGAHSALLSDVGLGRFLRPGLTLTGVAIAGSVEFLDPAVIRGEAPTRSSEVWALGATLHRALGGVGLYGELPDNEPLLAIRRVMSTSPVVAEHLTPGAAALIRDCLDTAERRLPTAGAVAERLAGLAGLDGELVTGG